MTRVHIYAGICGFETEVMAQADDCYEVNVNITSSCSRIQNMACELLHVSALEDISKPVVDTAVFQAAAKYHLHPSCPVPCGIMKAIEHAAGLALPADVRITISE